MWLSAVPGTILVQNHLVVTAPAYRCVWMFFFNAVHHNTCLVARCVEVPLRRNGTAAHPPQNAYILSKKLWTLPKVELWSELSLKNICAALLHCKLEKLGHTVSEAHHTLTPIRVVTKVVSWVVQFSALLRTDHSRPVKIYWVVMWQA